MAGELEKLEANLGGVADMRRQPDAVFIIDLKKEQLAVREARRLGLPVVALVDTNCDPDESDYVIPGNDDAIRSCALITRVIADAVAAGKQKVTAQELASAAAREAREAAAAAEQAAVAASENGAAAAAAEEAAPATADEPAAETAAPEATEVQQ
jgi:small subunit ribosomal protein S2